MAPSETEWMTTCPNIILSATALYFSTKLFKNHRAPSVGLFLLGTTAGFCIFHPCNSYMVTLQTEAEWASEILVAALVSFDFLWLSADHGTALALLCSSCLLVASRDWLAADALTLLTRCMALSSLSSCLTVCLFAGNVFGAVGGVTLSLPLLVASGAEGSTLGPLISPAATEGLMKWLLKGSMAVGCWASTRALSDFLLEVTEQSFTCIS